MKAAMYNLQFRLPRDFVMGTGASAGKKQQNGKNGLSGE